MSTAILKSFLSKNLGVPETDIAPIVDTCRTRKVEKGAFLLRENEHCEHTFFVEKGLLRQFSIGENGREHILTFAPEHWFVTDRESVYHQQPSVYFIQALEDSEVVLIDRQFNRRLAEKFPDYIEISTRLLHNHIRHLQNRINLLLSADAGDRYLRFAAMYPDILMRVPQAMIASFIGITPESLSRVRKTLSKGKPADIS